MSKSIEQRIREELARKIVVRITRRKRAARFVVTTPFYDGKVMDTPTTQATKAIALTSLLVQIRCLPQFVWKIEAVK